MSFCRTALRTLRRLRPPAAASVRLCSAQESLWKLGMDESVDHNYPTPWIGVVSEIMKNPLTEQVDIVDFYNCLSDKPLSFDEIEMGRDIFSSGYLGSRYGRAWLFASLNACFCLSHRAMGLSFLQYFMVKKDVQTPANYLAALRFVSTEPSCMDMKRDLIKKMKEDFDEDERMICSKDLRKYLTLEGDWKTLLDLGETFAFSRNDMNIFFESAFTVCIDALDLHAAKEVVAKYRENDMLFRPHMVSIAIQVLNLAEETSTKKLKTYSQFMDLIFQDLDLGAGSYIKYEEATLLVDFFSRLSSPEWIAAKDCGTNKRGQCSNCGTKLKHFNPTSSDLKYMLEDFKDVTFLEARKLYSSRATLKTFEKFIDNSGQFDLVFDTMNFFGVLKRGQQSDRFFRVLIDLIREYNPKGILFVGKNFPNEKKMDFVKNFINTAYPEIEMITFNVPRLFKDDAFALYAAVSRNAYLVTNDAYRDHVALLPERSRPLWKQWLVSRQIVITPYTLSHPVDSMPFLYGSVAKGTLHIPHFSQPSNKAQASKHAFLCLRVSKGARRGVKK